VECVPSGTCLYELQTDSGVIYILQPSQYFFDIPADFSDASANDIARCMSIYDSVLAVALPSQAAIAATIFNSLLILIFILHPFRPVPPGLVLLLIQFFQRF
jgi:hypothetical protein